MDIYEKCKQAIDDVFFNSGFINLVINKYIGDVELKNQPLFTKIVYGVVENKLLLDYNINYYLTKEIKNRDVMQYLRIGAFGLKFLNLSDALIGNEIVALIKNVDYHLAGVSNALLKKISAQDLKLPNDSLISNLSIKYSYPEKIVDFLLRMYPLAINQILEHPTNTYNTYIINTIKEFDLSKIKCDYQIIDGAIVTKNNLNNTPLVKGGYLLNQNLSSHKVIDLVDIKPKMKVIDMCSAPGTKAIALAIKANNDLDITCLDLHPHKVELIKKEAIHLGVKLTNVLAADATTFQSLELFDLVMLDAPCSGLGVMKHKVDLKYHFSFKKLEELYVLQKALLGKAYKLCQNNGTIIYSTCTINKYENEEMIQYFLKKHKDIKIIEEIKMLPDDLYDGFYICKMKKEKKDE